MSEDLLHHPHDSSEFPQGHLLGNYGDWDQLMTSPR